MQKLLPKLPNKAQRDKLSFIQLAKMIVTLIAFGALVYFFYSGGIDIQKPEGQLKLATYFTLIATFCINATEFFQSGSKGVRADQDRERIKKLEDDYAPLHAIRSDWQATLDKVESQTAQINDLNKQIEQLTTLLKASEKKEPA